MTQDPLENVLPRLDSVREVSQGQYEAHCPTHDDRKASLAIRRGDNGGVILHCHAGCKTEEIVGALGLKMTDLFPEKSDEPRRKSFRCGLNVAEIAKAKRLPVEFLAGLGVEDRQATKDVGDKRIHWPEVLIRYYNQDGTLALRHRRRFSLDGDRKFAWTGTKADGAIVPYGLQRLHLAAEAGYVVFVEGETDCWALWHHGYPALGFPGANYPKKLCKANQLDGIKTVFVFHEPDAGGDTFVSCVARRLREFKRFDGQIRVIKVDAKDPSDLHIKLGDGFRAAFDKGMKDATTLSTLAPATTTTPEGSVVARGRPRTDLGNAERLQDHYGEELLYCGDTGRWMVWDGKRWSGTMPGLVYIRAHKVVRLIHREASQSKDPEVADALRRHAVASESCARIEAMVRLARDMLSVSVSQLDRDPMLFNCLNGTIDLRTLEIRAHRHEDYISKLAPVMHDPEANCPRWMAFLDEVLAGNEDRKTFIQRAIGYSMTGDTGEECMFILYGTGRNGKTKLLEAVREMMGDYAMTTPATTLLDKGQNANSASNDVARLKGARFVTASETQDGQRLDESQVKVITGGDTMTARHLYKDFFEFRPECKLFLGCNHKPRVRGSDEGVWSRIRLIPFEVTISEERRDPRLLEKFRAELPGILQWALVGCYGWQQSRLPRTGDIRFSTDTYRDEMDLFGQFLQDCCILGLNAQVQSSVLYAVYVKWCTENGEKAQAKRNFAMRLKEKGFKNAKGAKGVRLWNGLNVIPGMEDVSGDGSGPYGSGRDRHGRHWSD